MRREAWIAIVRFRITHRFTQGIFAKRVEHGTFKRSEFANDPLMQAAQEVQRQGARCSMSGGVLLYVDAKSGERNEAYELLEQPANVCRRLR